MKKIVLSLLTVFMVLSLSVVLVKASENTTTVSLEDGVQIRTDGNNGLKWVANVENYVEGNEYGFLFAQGDLAEVTLATEGVVKQVVEGVTAEDPVMSATMVNFPKKAANQDISVVAYVYDGENYSYSNVVVRNLAEVAVYAKNSIDGGFVNAVAEYVGANYKNVYTDTLGNIFVTNAVYETNPANLEKAFISDWNSAFGTEFAEFEANAWNESAVDGATKNAYTFFVENELISAKWNWVLDFLLAANESAVKPIEQINALKDAENGEVVLESFAELAASLENFFDVEANIEGDVITFTANSYLAVIDYNTTIYAQVDELVTNDEIIELPEIEKEGYELDGYTDGTTTYENTYTVTDNSVVLTPVFTKAVPTYVITRENASTPGFYVKYRESYTFVDAENNGVFVSNNKGKNSSGAYMDVFFTDSGTFTFTYTVSSESKYDKFNVYAKSDGVAYRQILKDISGEVTATKTINVSAGDYIYFQYSKDSSGNSGSDTVTLSNLTFVTDEFYTTSVLSFNTVGGNEIADLEVYNNAKIAAPQAPVKDGYFFDGWYTDGEYTEVFDFETGINGNTTIYAKYTQGVTLEFANTGDTVVEKVVVRPNTAITAPDVTLVKEGAYFNGWYADDDCTIEFDFATGIEKDTVIYAGWRNPVRVVFNSNGGSEVEDIYTDINVAITLPSEPTKENYVFAGWYKEQEFYTKFTGENGVTESTTVYAKWLKEVTITYMYGEEEVGTENAVENDVFTPTTPSTFVALVLGWYTDSALTNEFAADTVLTADDVTLYAKVANFVPAGVLSSFINGADSSYEWVYDDVNGTFTSGNKGKHSSKSILEITFAKESFTAFSYVVNSESNYDYLTIYINGTKVYSSKVSGKNGTDITGSFSQTFAPGDVLKIQFEKDSSGSQGSDCAVLSNFVINDGVPAANITFKYQDAGVEDAVLNANLNDVIVDIEGFDTYAPACDNITKKFGGWYYDEACTKPLGDTDLITSSIVLYAKYLYSATIEFDTDGGNEIDPISVWTGISIEEFMPENPSKQGYIFRYWLDENSEEFIPANGVTGDILLTAYFEELSKGATKDVAVEIELENGEFSYNATTDEEFQNFYFVLTPEVTDYYYFKFPQEGAIVNGGSVSGNGYRRYWIEDAEGNTIASKEGSDRKVLLEADTTYYVVYNLAYSSYTAWGTFNAEVYTYSGDSAAEAIEYEFGTQVTTVANAFKTSTHTIVYEFTAESNATYALKFSSNAWARATVYSDDALSNQIAYNQVYNANKVVDLTVEAGQTYYIVLSQNWSGSGLVNNTMTFSVVEYPKGYTATNPFEYTVGEVINAEFANGNNAYYQVEVAEAGTYKLSILSISDTNSKTIDLYNADMTEKVATLSGTAAADYYIENLEAGTYVIKVYNTSTSYNTSFTASLTKVTTGLYWTTAEELTLAADMELNADGTYYYEFTTGTDVLWHFFETELGTVKVYNLDRTELGSYAQLAANTVYYLVVESEEATLAVTFYTLVDYADGKTPASAFTFNEETAVLPVEAKNTYTIYFKFTVAEAGTYRIYSYNDGNLDPAGTLYGDVTCSTQLKYNHDGGSDKVNAGIIGYKYDFYLEYALEAGVEYYLKVYYNTNSNSANSMTLHIENMAA